jgi:hypothetical protein
MRWQKRRAKTPLQLMIRALRKTNKYLKWRRAILDKWGFPEKTKGVQVHHRKEITTLLKEKKITTLKKALKCKALWDLDLGVPLTRGEHSLITKMSRHKYLTPGFAIELIAWLKTRQIRISKKEGIGFNTWASENSIRVKMGRETRPFKD